jgi:hypothetical protein
MEQKTKFTYSGYEINFLSDNVSVMCRKKGEDDEKTKFFKTFSEAKEYVNQTLDYETKVRALEFYKNKYADTRTYTIIVDKFDNKKRDCVNIENPNLSYSDMDIMHGMQCNFVGGTDKHKEVMDLCDQVSKLMIKIHQVNNGE